MPAPHSIAQRVAFSLMSESGDTMSFFVETCPRCSTQRVVLDVQGHAVSDAGYTNDFFVVCKACERGSVFTVLGIGPEVPKNKRVEEHVHEKSPDGGVKVPQHLPPDVERPYVQGQSNLSQSNLDAAGMMFRKTLDVATANLDPTLKSKSFNERINLLESAGKITPALSAWAHEVRKDGNDAAHDGAEPSRDSVRQLAGFTEMFLLYAFTMPHELAAKKAATASP